MVRKNRIDTRPRMVVNFDKCVHVERGDEPWARPATPYSCAPCLTSGGFSAKLRFDGSPVPLCGDHDPHLEMQEATKHGRV